MIVHVLPGDAQVEEFKRTGLEGELVVCREAFIDGDVRADSLDELWRVRERFLNATYPDSQIDYRSRVAAEFEKLTALPANAEVNLWFEYELFCQVNMWFCVWLLREHAGDLYRIVPFLQEKKSTWSGFAEFNGEDLSACYAERIKFSDRDIKLGTELWTAYTDRDHAKLRELSVVQSPCFPYLKEACEAEIEKEFRPKQILRELRNDGISDFGKAFAAFRERAGVYGFGDVQVRRLMSDV